MKTNAVVKGSKIRRTKTGKTTFTKQHVKTYNINSFKKK